ncbi:Pup--protein ligase [Candidatus Methylomirabilis limnetica]|uniref:Pup--protein ligase n=1 Tax=Candidatus Methylomirabilis limnetica TaxID=2033718 RepID=A0A2T4U127_9BACT|nr:Pup--protein ligase [Candidatus Methylomirabilis limnetica]PTL37074.1 Pup--protein ligase [Candidatus Methylomirabilis limnetica]
MQERILGLESEYGLISSSGGGRVSLSVESALGYLFEKVVSRQRGTNDFLRNGARLYQDTGCHPEYATPECDNSRDLVIHDKAGERIVEELLLGAEQKLRENGIYCDIYIFKNNTDSVGNTYGCHENYLVQRDVSFHKLAEQLIPFFVTRQVFAGAGKVLRTRMGNHYYISQRAQHIYQEISGATTSSRGIINTRDEPHADEEKYRRLHVIVGDSNMSEVATYLKVGTTAIVLAMIEDGFIKRDLTLEDPVRAIKEISHDVTCRRRVRLKRGKEFSAVEIQREYLDLAREYYQDRERSPQVTDLLERWQYVLDQLALDPMTLHRELDWVIKHALITSYINRKGCSFDDQRVFMLDLQYHDIKRTRGLYYLMLQGGLIDRVITEGEIETAMTTPPQTTRAKVRSDFIKYATERNKSYDVGWSYLKLNDRYQRTILCKDPFKAWDPRVDELIGLS